MEEGECAPRRAITTVNNHHGQFVMMNGQSSEGLKGYFRRLENENSVVFEESAPETEHLIIGGFRRNECVGEAEFPPQIRCALSDGFPGDASDLHAALGTAT